MSEYHRHLCNNPGCPNREGLDLSEPWNYNNCLLFGSSFPQVRLRDPVEQPVDTNGLIGIIYSVGHGNGWSCCHPPDEAREMCLDQPLANRIHQFNSNEANKTDLELRRQLKSFIKERWPRAYVDDRTLLSLRVRWVKPGTPFIVTEYDCSENILIPCDLTWNVAYVKETPPPSPPIPVPLSTK